MGAGAGVGYGAGGAMTAEGRATQSGRGRRASAAAGRDPCRAGIWAGLAPGVLPARTRGWRTCGGGGRAAGRGAGRAWAWGGRGRGADWRLSACARAGLRQVSHWPGRGVRGGGRFTGRRDFFFHIFAPTLALVFLFLVLSLFRDRAGHLPAAPVQVLFLQRLDLLRLAHATVVLVLVDLWRSAPRAPVPPIPDPVFPHVKVGSRSRSASGLFVPNVLHGRQDVSGLASAGQPVLGDPWRAAGDGLVGAHDVLEGVYGAVVCGGGQRLEGGGGGGHCG